MVLTLFNLENSRAFRVLWLANELNVTITSRNYARIGGKKAVSKESDREVCDERRGCFD
jgi:hypothetical protein